MDFSLNEKQLGLQKKFREAFTKEIAPRAASTDSDETLPKSNWNLLAETGFLGLNLPKEFGGAGEDNITYVAALEELAAACASTALCAAASSWLCGGAIASYGTSAAKKKWLPKLADGTAIGAYAISDPSGGAISDIALKAAKTASGYELTGAKAFVTNAPVADTVITFARMEDGKLSTFLVEKTFSGFKFGEPIKTMGLRGAPVADIHLDGCAVPAENLLGAEGAGEAFALELLDAARISTAALAVGIARAAYIEGKFRAETRASGGKPIGAYQEVAFRVADMYIEADTARQLTYFAAWAKTENRSDARSAISIAKLYASETAVRNANRAVQVLGGHGYTRNAAAERIYRDAKYTEIGDGPSEIQRMLIADALLRD